MAKVQLLIRFCAALCAVATVASVASAHVSEILMTQATLLGGLDKDCTPNATTTCEVNMVEAVAWCRNLTATGVVHAFLPTLDRNHILTKLHPKDWGANFALHKQLGAAVGFLSTFSFTADATLAQYSVRRDDAPLVDDFDFPVGHNLRPALTARLVETATSLHIVTSRRRLQDLDTVAAQAAVAMEKSDTFREQQGAYKNTMLIVSESSPEEYAAALAKHGARPEIICRFLASTDSVEFKNDTWMVNVKTDKTHLHRLAIHRLSNTSSTIVNVTLTAQPLELPAANRADPQYVADRAMMKAGH